MANMRSIKAEGISCILDYALITEDGEIILTTYLERAKAKVKALACTLGKKSVSINYKRYSSKAEYRTAYKPINMGYDRFVYATSINKKVGESYLLTTEEYKKEDLFQHLMTTYKLPLLESWIDYLFQQLEEKRYLLIDYFFRWDQRYVSDANRTLTLHGKQVPVEEIILLNLEMLNNQVLTEIVSCGLKQGNIKITDKKMESLKFKDFDSYITGYGPSMVNNLEKEIETLAPLQGKVPEVAFKTKRMFPPQAACVNGMVALKESGSRYGLMIEGMGCGKTLQGAGVVDAYFNKCWLKQHPKKGLKDLYQSNNVHYRVVMMAPSHLVGKWRTEVLKEIPQAKVTILDDFSKLIELREKGKKRNGREWYFISKDTAKLGSQYSPIPTTVGKAPIMVGYCSSCFEERGVLVAKHGTGNRARCPECGGRHFFKRDGGYGHYRGLLCPDCGELLIKSSTKLGKDIETPADMVLTPTDFAQRSAVNSVCYHCGSQLWGVDCKPVDMGGEYSSHVANYKPKWYKISHWKNYSKKNKKSAFVLKGYEEAYMYSTGMEEYEVSKREYGPRKTAPSLYIKKYLKGYFDMCILDECHKYENGGTAQSNAAHALMKVSKFTLGLTGTICNGKADSFFYLLYMLDPTRMRKMGYEYSDVTKFVEKYGTLETVYKNDGNVDGVYNSSSRGRQLQSPKVKPGISPLLFTEFLLDKSVFLDLSDLSRYIPKLEEKVELVPMEEELSYSYWHTLNVLKAAIKSREGRGLLSEVLQFGLSYPDKPYGRKPIMSPSEEDVIITRPYNYDQYAEPKELLAKERKLVDIVNEEIQEGRNCFVYCSYTGNGETNVTTRLQSIIETHCNLRGRVQIMQSTSPKATEREEWIAKKASEGIKVFICNPKAVETGCALASAA